MCQLSICLKMAGEGSLVANVIIKWGGTEYPVCVTQSGHVRDLKENIYKETGVKPMHQKLLGLKFKGK